MDFYTHLCKFITALISLLSNLLIMQADIRQFICLKSLLNTFTPANGLKVRKSEINFGFYKHSEERAQNFEGTINYQKGQFPFTYLGLPLGLYKPTVEQCFPMVNRIVRILAGMATSMTYAGRLLVVKSILASLPIFFMGCLDMHVTIKK